MSSDIQSQSCDKTGPLCHFLTVQYTRHTNHAVEPATVAATTPRATSMIVCMSIARPLIDRLLLLRSGRSKLPEAV